MRHNDKGMIGCGKTGLGKGMREKSPEVGYVVNTHDAAAGSHHNFRLDLLPHKATKNYLPLSPRRNPSSSAVSPRFASP